MKNVRNLKAAIRKLDFKDKIELMDWLNSWYAHVIEEDINNQLFRGVVEE